MKKIYIISSVRKADKDMVRKLEQYAMELQRGGDKVYLPHRDTKQDMASYLICLQNKQAIVEADEIHIFYESESQGSHFDLGMAFMYNKPIKIIENGEVGEGKSFPRMLEEWEAIDSDPF
jgi:hypothetical protein